LVITQPIVFNNKGFYTPFFEIILLDRPTLHLTITHQTILDPIFCTSEKSFSPN